MLRLMRLISVITLALAASVIVYVIERPAEASETLSTSTDDGLSLTPSEDGQVVGPALTDTHLTQNTATYPYPLSPNNKPEGVYDEQAHEYVKNKNP